MPGFSARNDTLCNAFGAAILGLIATTAIAADAPARADAPAHDYPTVARVEYVQECMNRAGAHQGTMYQCACAIDRIADKLSYDDFVEASTFAKYSTLPGEGGGIFRDTDEAKKKAKLFRTIESDAFRACNVPIEQK
jgi:hypothetical protein